MAKENRDTIRLTLRMYRFAARHWLLIACTFLASASYAGFQMYYLKLIEPVIKAFTSEPGPNQVVDLATLERAAKVSLWLILPVVVSGWLAEYLRGSVLWRIVIDLRDAICRALLPQSVGFFEDNRSGDFISRISNDVSMAQKAVNFIFGDIYELPVKLFIALYFAVYSSWQLSLSLVVIGPLLILPMQVFGRRIRRASRKGLERLADVTDAMSQMFSGIRIVKAFKMEDAEADEFSHVNERFLRNMRRAVRNRAHGRGVLEFFVRCFFAAIILIGGPALANRWLGLEPWRMVMFVGAIWLAYDPLRSLIKAYNNLQEASAGAERIFEIIDLRPEIRDEPGAVDLRSVREGVVFEDVTFSYDDEPVLRNVHLEVQKGQTVAIVGRSGAGKSTMIDLLMRFYDTQRGAIKIDGRDVRSIRRESLLDRVAVVAQQQFLFNRSVAENIRYGRRDATDEEVRAAARAANIHDFIASLPEGYETRVGEFGVKLSGGQRQRIAIARAVLKNADILILDEAMVGLDSESENLVRQALFDLMEDRTTFVITHDLTTIQHADMIVVLSDGRIVQKGTHEELVGRPGEYATLYRQRFQSVTASPEDGQPVSAPEPDD